MYDELYKRRSNRHTGVDNIKTLNSDVNYKMKELIENTTMKNPNVPGKNGRKIGYAIKYFGYDSELTKKIQEAEAMGGNSQLNQLPVSNNSIS